MSSLRERHRCRTANTIRRAAINLAYERGLDNVTIDMISDAAGISVRTFFNYFSYKEAAFIPPALDFPQEIIDWFVSSKGKLLDDIVTLFGSLMDEIHDDREYFRKNHEIALANPKLLVLKMGVFNEFDNIVVELLIKRLASGGNMGADKTEAEIRHIAALIMVSIRVGFESWIEAGKGDLATIVIARIKGLKNVFNGC